MHKQKCIFCGEEFVCRDIRTKHCNKEECIKAWNKYKYLHDTTTCICEICGIEYKATRKQSKNRCKDCVKKFRIVNFKTHQQNLRCKYCGQIVNTIIKHNTQTVYDVYNAVCDECRRINREQVSHYMKLNNPSYKGNNLTEEQYNKKQEIKEYHQSEEYKEHRKNIVKKQRQERMKNNNPMENPVAKQKMRNTLNAKIQQGLIKYPRGQERSNYKGNTRTINKYLRCCLTQWRQENLQRANYCCELCGANKCFLNIHHKIPLRDIIDMGANKLDIDITTLTHNSEDYIKLEQWVLNFHNNNDCGIVVCIECHSLIDSKFHPPKQ